MPKQTSETKKLYALQEPNSNLNALAIGYSSGLKPETIFGRTSQYIVQQLSSTHAIYI
jgi:hypothetical protein